MFLQRAECARRASGFPCILQMALGLEATASGHMHLRKAKQGEEKPHGAERHALKTRFVLLGHTKGTHEKEGDPKSVPTCPKQGT